MDRSSTESRPQGPVALDSQRARPSRLAAAYRFVHGMFRPPRWQEHGSVRLPEAQRWADGRTAAFVDEAAVLRLLTYLKTERIKASAGKIQLVHLAEIRETVGEHWQRYADRALDLAQIVLRERLTSRDVYTRHGDDAFIVIFRDLDEPEAEAAAAAITKEICDRLFNDPTLGRDVSARSITAGIAKLMTRDSAPDLGALDRALERISKRRTEAMQQAEDAKAEALPRYEIRYTCDYRPMLFVPTGPSASSSACPGASCPTAASSAVRPPTRRANRARSRSPWTKPASSALSATSRSPSPRQHGADRRDDPHPYAASEQAARQACWPSLTRWSASIWWSRSSAWRTEPRPRPWSRRPAGSATGSGDQPADRVALRSISSAASPLAFTHRLRPAAARPRFAIRARTRRGDPPLRRARLASSSAHAFLRRRDPRPFCARSWPPGPDTSSATPSPASSAVRRNRTATGTRTSSTTRVNPYARLTAQNPLHAAIRPAGARLQLRQGLTGASGPGQLARGQSKPTDSQPKRADRVAAADPQRERRAGHVLPPRSLLRLGGSRARRPAGSRQARREAQDPDRLRSRDRKGDRGDRGAWRAAGRPWRARLPPHAGGHRRPAAGHRAPGQPRRARPTDDRHGGRAQCLREWEASRKQPFRGAWRSRSYCGLRAGEGHRHRRAPWRSQDRNGGRRGRRDRYSLPRGKHRPPTKRSRSAE